MSPMSTEGEAVGVGAGLAEMAGSNGDVAALAGGETLTTALAGSISEVNAPERPDEAAGDSRVQDEPATADELATANEPAKPAEPVAPAEPAEPAAAEGPVVADDLEAAGEPASAPETEPETEPVSGTEAPLGSEPVSEMETAPELLATPLDMTQMLFVDVVLMLPATHPVVVLQEADAPFRELRIPVGGAEGIAIAYAARGVATPKPLTHELFARVFEEYGMSLDVVRITEVRGSSFSAEMVLSGPQGVRLIECRPSDGIALALRQRLPVPIMAALAVLSIAGTDPLGAN